MEERRQPTSADTPALDQSLKEKRRAQAEPAVAERHHLGHMEGPHGS
jgi:hypothetical protein